MTRRGLVIEGNYRIGEKVPVVYDYSSRRFLPVFRKERGIGIAERVRLEGPARGSGRHGHYYLAKYLLSPENKIFFTALGAVPSESADFYIDLGDVLTTVGMVPYALRLLEDRAYMGILVLFTRYALGWWDFTDGWVLRFKVGVKTNPQVTVVYGGRTYYKHDFEYVLDLFDTTNDALMDVLPDLNIHLGHGGALGESEGPLDYKEWGLPFEVGKPCARYWGGDTQNAYETTPYNWEAETSIQVGVGTWQWWFGFPS